jgi:predicted nuclease of predicted toxin-antitoxin system
MRSIVLEIGLHCAEDSDILAVARDQNRACVTLDHDFILTSLSPGRGALL